jgi:predicted MFS family arabinose efflux permease
MRNAHRSFPQISINLAQKAIASRLWGVNLTCISASTFSYVFLSYWIYRVTGNIVFSEMVLLSPMIMPVLFVFQINRLARDYQPRNVMLWASLISMAAYAVTFALLEGRPWLALTGAAAIGLLDSIQRVTRVVAVRAYFGVEQVKSTIPLTLTAQFVAGGLAGVFMSSLRDRLTPEAACVVSCTLAMFSALCAYGIRAANPSQAPVTAIESDAVASAWSQFIGALRASPELTERFLAFLILIGVFQGFFNVSRVALPAEVLGLSSEYVGLLQVVNSSAALVGALTFYALGRREKVVNATVASTISALAMIACSTVHQVAISYTAYFLFIFFFELAFFKLQSDIVAACAREHVAVVVTLQYAAVSLAMMLAIFLGGIAVSKVGLSVTALLFCAVFFLSTLVMYVTFRPRGAQLLAVRQVEK